MKDLLRGSPEEREDFLEDLRRNDPAVTKVSDYVFPFIFPRGLMDCLLRNTVVQQLDLRWSGDDEEESDRHNSYYGCDRLRSYIETSPSLRRVSFSGYDDYSIAAYIDAVAKSKCIQDFAIMDPGEGFLNANITAIVCLLQTTRSIERLILPLSSRFVNDVGGALQNNQTVERLTIYSLEEGNVSTLSNLHNHGKIQNLEVQVPEMYNGITPYPISEAISSWLQANTVVTTFTMTGMRLDATGMEHILHGLQRNRSIAKLSFKSSWFTREALAAFVAHFQETNGRGRTPGHVKDLHMEKVLLFHPDDTGMIDEDDNYDNVVIPEEKKREKELNALMARLLQGSCLVSATFLDRPLHGFWTTLEENANEEQNSMLSHLHVGHGYGCDVDLAAAFRHIPNLSPTLVSLQFWAPRSMLWSKTRNNRALLESLQKNGSLQTSIVKCTDICGDGEFDEDAFTPELDRFLQAWLQRNRDLPGLIETCGTMAATAAEENKSRKRGREIEETAVDIDDVTAAFPSPSLAFMPHLLVSGLATPRMSLHHVFHGVVASSESILGRTTGSGTNKE